jgi:hypothetical protein
MTDLTATDLRPGLIDSLRACRDAERTIFAALDPAVRDAPGADGGWSPKDHLAHLSAWRHRQAIKMAALRAGDPEPQLPAEGLDATNAIFHDERAGWPWAQVEADADTTADELVAEVQAASDGALRDQKVLGPILGDGPEHDVAHLGPIAAGVGLEERVLALAATTQAMIDGGGWPDTSAAYARYNLACFHALGGRLDQARALLRVALPADETLRTLAPNDDDLIALRDELPALGGG